MRTDAEKRYLFKAIDAFGKRLIVISPEYRILAASRPTNESKEDVIGKHCYEVYYERTSPCNECSAKVVLETEKPSLNLQPNHPVQHGPVPCYYAYPIFSKGEIEAVVSSDFTMPLAGELSEKLQQSNAMLHNLIFSAVDGVIAADKSGKILIFNEAAAQITGHSLDEALTKLDIRDIYPGEIEYDVMAKLRSSEYGRKGKLKSYLVDLLNNKGEKIPICLNAAIVYKDEKEVATIGLFHDMREEISMKQELEKTQLQLLQTEKMASLGKLAAGVAHQLNNPLSGITLFTKLILEDYELEEAAQDDLKRVLKDAERCRDTVKELLEFSRQTRRLMRPHDINRAILRTLFLLENQTLFHNIEIIKDLDENLPQVTSDVQQLNHLFMNVILNAAQAMKGRGEMIVNTFPVDKDWIQIEISDTGPGIPGDIIQHIFDPFFTTKEEGEGTGLGLSLAYGIVKNHRGTIRAESGAGKGTKFIIVLPTTEKDNREDEKS